jgi:uncharacterized protein GlcG (DUF336 family)
MFGIEAGFHDPLAFVARRLPDADADCLLVGAIGVGGGSPDHDNEVAEAVKSALM